MKISDHDIEEGLNTAAKLTNAYGDKFWPFFEFLEAELEFRQAKSNRLRSRLKQTMQTYHDENMTE